MPERRRGITPKGLWGLTGQSVLLSHFGLWQFAEDIGLQNAHWNITYKTSCLWKKETWSFSSLPPRLFLLRMSIDGRGNHVPHEEEIEKLVACRSCVFCMSCTCLKLVPLGLFTSQSFRSLGSVCSTKGAWAKHDPNAFQSKPFAVAFTSPHGSLCRIPSLC